ncbi:hypothetical protein [Bacteroides finegoldii]|mgnify:CR=1 FL=1|jgi:hypothetical protein|uniref:hypothetical protein n=1 Tax=Bacteroides finegoldii TaxID=338188 RepID=UPI0020501A33|nr:hypothetical protein [Bacteroides finegoldii]DAY72322.1 MAG TPA: hypothetical protein [Caudoviricetes sp.]DAZ54777.1 MAG TPA: hypothetical protein [Caudoviricetes sp.]
MGFTTAAFIRKNTPELRNKLEELGYYLHPECIDDDRGNYLFVNREYYLNRPLGYLEEFSRSIDCGTNEELFLAIAALRDDTNYMQWFVCTSDYKEFDGKEWKVGDFDLNTCPDDFDNILPHWRKATVNELIEHFKEKEE